jgi:Beta-lactamase enzyme family
VECPLPQSGFDCDFQRRFVAAQAYVAKRPGTVGIVVRDRQTGAVWRNEHAAKLVWTASTVKLAMTVDLLLRERAGTIALADSDRALIQAMLHSSDDKAADSLWSRFGRDDYATRFPSYGLTSITFVPGFQRYWGFMKCTPDDLDRLMRYVLDKLPADLREYIVGQMRSVAANQQWGVWGAGPAARPGNKDGWSEENTGWVMNSVGFVGPAERYTLALMNDLHGKGGYDQGKATDSEVARLIFAGRF